jgi:hypothetical protein
MEFQIHNRYLFSVGVPELQELQAYTDMIIEEYDKKSSLSSKVSDVPVTPQNKKLKGFRDFLLPLIHKQVQKYFIIEEQWGYDLDIVNIYMQRGVTPEEAQRYVSSSDGFHNHSVHGISLTGVVYLTLPEVGGEFETMHLPYWNSHITKPELNRIYFFPNWIYHRPLPQQDESPRICINWAIRGEKRVIARRWNEAW